MRAAFVAAIVCLAARLAGATVIVPADLGELSREAQLVARGRVSAIDARWTDDRRGIETIVTLEVEASLKGSPGEALTFRVPGGTLGRYRSIVVGAPDFAVGQRVVVFLGGRIPAMPFVIGLGQGVYRVQESTAGVAVVVPPPMTAAVAGPIVRGSLARRPAPLDAFERDVRRLVAEGR